MALDAVRSKAKNKWKPPCTVLVQMDLLPCSASKYTTIDFSKHSVHQDEEEGSTKTKFMGEDERNMREILNKKYKGNKKLIEKRFELEYNQFKHLGMGYDMDDPFIDDAQPSEELIVPNRRLKHGGFYVNRNQMQFKQVNEFGDDDDDEPEQKQKKLPKEKSTANKTKHNESVASTAASASTSHMSTATDSDSLQGTHPGGKKRPLDAAKAVKAKKLKVSVSGDNDKSKTVSVSANVTANPTPKKKPSATSSAAASVKRKLAIAGARSSKSKTAPQSQMSPATPNASAVQQPVVARMAGMPPSKAKAKKLQQRHTPSLTVTPQPSPGPVTTSTPNPATSTPTNTANVQHKDSTTTNTAVNTPSHNQNVSINGSPNQSYEQERLKSLVAAISAFNQVKDAHLAKNNGQVNWSSANDWLPKFKKLMYHCQEEPYRKKCLATAAQDLGVSVDTFRARVAQCERESKTNKQLSFNSSISATPNAAPTASTSASTRPLDTTHRQSSPEIVILSPTPSASTTHKQDNRSTPSESGSGTAAAANSKSTVNSLQDTEIVKMLGKLPVPAQHAFTAFWQELNRNPSKYRQMHGSQERIKWSQPLRRFILLMDAKLTTKSDKGVMRILVAAILKITRSSLSQELHKYDKIKQQEQTQSQQSSAQKQSASCSVPVSPIQSTPTHRTPVPIDQTMNESCPVQVSVAGGVHAGTGVGLGTSNNQPNVAAVSGAVSRTSLATSSNTINNAQSHASNILASISTMNQHQLQDLISLHQMQSSNKQFAGQTQTNSNGAHAQHLQHIMNTQSQPTNHNTAHQSTNHNTAHQSTNHSTAHQPINTLQYSNPLLPAAMTVQQQQQLLMSYYEDMNRCIPR